VAETLALRITREDFYELLSDHVRIAEAVLKNLANRLRSLADRVGAEIGKSVNN
jgi:CRP-like cAMP-binding protein